MPAASSSPTTAVSGPDSTTRMPHPGALCAAPGSEEASQRSGAGSAELKWGIAASFAASTASEESTASTADRSKASARWRPGQPPAAEDMLARLEGVFVRRCLQTGASLDKRMFRVDQVPSRRGARGFGLVCGFPQHTDVTQSFST